MVRFIHTADLHLDQTFKNLPIKDDYLQHALAEATLNSFDNLIQTAINEQVDFFLIVGDIYHGARATLRAQFAFANGMQRLADAEIPVYMLYGNHDFDADANHRLKLPNNVHIFGHEVETKYLSTHRGEKVAISGFSYDQQWIADDRSAEYPTRDPLVDIHIGMIHGDNSSSNGQKHYAPFNPSDLVSHGFDYWALGHIHKGQVLYENPTMVYPGNIQGASFKEDGAKGALIVNLEKGGYTNLEFIETAEWQFQQSTRELGLVDSLESLRNTIEVALHDHIMYAKDEAVNVISRMTFTTNGDEESLYWWHTYADELLEQLQWSLRNQNASRAQKVYLVALDIQVNNQAVWSPSPVFNDSMKRAFEDITSDDEQFQTLVADLEKNGQWQRLVGANIDVDQFKADILAKAKEQIILEQASYSQEQRRF
ncbi:DNA repair exonuclease [Aerococcus agrisoli]|uniref:DNA repair exonuclease n=1 Tax=Aerococcus agrisoli TaxID=2487350 RepID=A0A3N4GE77_9LACT|nr:DNA repair exonuclease [Aerococcus agrisoli]RPA60535.1 DNA repair exonuclease [Aerococcus agrisoli]